MSMDLEYLIENSELIVKALRYYSKSLKNVLDDNPQETLPLFRNTFEETLEEAQILEEILTSEDFEDVVLLENKMEFILSVLVFYRDQLKKELMELEQSKNSDKQIEIIQKEIHYLDNAIETFPMV